MDFLLSVCAVAYRFLAALGDTLFPLSPAAACVRDTSLAALQALCLPRRVGDTLALAAYQTPLMRAFIHEAKFHHNERAITMLGHFLGDHLKQTAACNTHLVPIPLSPARLRERGYNQVTAIARAALSCAPQVRLDETLLSKVRHTAPQTSLSRTARLGNLKGAFAIGECALALDTPLLILDDITTTGATLAEATRTLRAAGFTHIATLALAH